MGLLAHKSLAQPQPGQLYQMHASRLIDSLTSDRLAGRGYGPADGARKAARFLAAQFERLGLEPFGDSVGKSYYQHFALPINTFPGSLRLSLDGRSLRPGYEFIAAPDCPSADLSGRVVLFDTTWFGIDTGALKQRLRPRTLRGRVLVLRAPDEKRLAKLPGAVQRWVQSAAAVLIREPKKLTASLAREQAPQPRLHVLDSAWTRGPVPRRFELTVGARFEPAYPAMNIIGRVRGTGASDSVLVVTAHYDHLGQQGPEVTFYGANDNASGTAMLLDLARYYAYENPPLASRHPPRHDILFIAFGAEEAGLIGSQWCVAHPPVPLKRIRFLVNLDLEGFGDGATVVNATFHKKRFQLLDSLSRTAHVGGPLPLKQRGRAANSDHYPFSERGVPAFFIYSLGGPGYYHDVRDRAPTLDLRKAARIQACVLEFLTALDAQP